MSLQDIYIKFVYTKQRKSNNVEIQDLPMERKYWQHAIGRTLLWTLSRALKSNLNAPPQLQTSQVSSAYTKYNILNDNNIPIVIEGFGTIQKVYKLDPFFSSSTTPKYTYLHT